jgi:ribose/xylose/arabinose/galactoside ABC-type transport system permease subunit
VNDAGGPGPGARAPAARATAAVRLSLLERLTPYVAYAALAGLIAIFGALAPGLFLTANNSEVILQNSAVQCVVAIGMTFVIIIGSIDLSVGSGMALVGMLAAMASTLVGGFAFFLTPFLGALIGLVNGVLFVYGGVPSFVVTLGMLSVARGLTIIISGGFPVSLPPTGFFASVGNAPWPFVIVVGLALAASFVLLKTAFGRYVLAVGGDEEKARMLGLPVNRVKVAVFTLSGALAGLGGGILAAEVGAGTPTMGTGFELTAISAVVIGGTSLTGGSGSILGTIVGSLVMSTLANGMIILGISTNVQIVMTGAVLVGAVMLSIQRGKIRIMK